MNNTIIVATDKMGGIAKDGKIPWYYSEDLQWFKTMTIGSTVICGRKTYETLPKKMDFRNIISVSRKTSDLDKILYENPHSYIIGGESIYNYCLATRSVKDIFLTYINEDYNCDKFFKVPPSFICVGEFAISNRLNVKRYVKWTDWSENDKCKLLHKIYKTLNIPELKRETI